MLAPVMHTHKGVTVGVTVGAAISLSTRHDGAKGGESLMNARYEKKVVRVNAK
jgi:hypothetical protein